MIIEVGLHRERMWMTLQVPFHLRCVEGEGSVRKKWKDNRTKIVALLGLYAALFGSLSPTFRKNQLVTSSGVILIWLLYLWRWDRLVFLKRRKQNSNLGSLRHRKSADLTHTATEAEVKHNRTKLRKQRTGFWNMFRAISLALPRSALLFLALPCSPLLSLAVPCSPSLSLVSRPLPCSLSPSLSHAVPCSL